MTTVPTIHLNGSSADNLYQEYKAAWNSVRAAITALNHCTCNARDFYPQGEAAFPMAKEERTEALANLARVEEYLANWLVHCQDYIKLENF